MALAVVADKAPASSATVSPARQALAEHLATRAKLEAEVARAQKPVAQLRDGQQRANGELASAEADLAKLEGDHAKAIAKAAKEGSKAPLPKAPAREKLLEMVEEAKRSKAAVEAALAECAAELNTATAALREVEGTVGPLLLGVMVEEFDLLLQAWRQEHEHFSAADNNLRGLLDAIGAYGRAILPGQGHAWLQERERMGAVCGKLPATPAGNFSINAAAWSALLARLRGDPNAAL